MGVPALFRWLSKKYPKIVSPVMEEEPSKMEQDDGATVEIPVDISGPNPNGEEFDNLYLDMNGIVHPCTHPEGKEAPATEEEMMVEIFNYTERVVNMVRPRKALFMAIDGVAPRAKMNQQRSRRFRAAQEAKDKAEAHEESLAIWEAMGKEVSEEERNKKSWDSNAITPGTPFMDLLASSLRYWVVKKLNTDPGWKNLQVYISDASVPGEGEHKIMDFVRRQRVNKGHDPNTKHVIYGLDADLIMLSLATHEPNFRVLREDVFRQSDACHICGQSGHYAAQCTAEKFAKPAAKPEEKKPFIFLDVAVLREYLEVELNVPNTPFPFHFEQALDDWVLLIFFVGNDFLPHLPSLEIREGAIDTLLKIWRTELPRMGGYLTNNGELQLHAVQIILEGLSRREDDIFARRKEAEERAKENAKFKRRRVDTTVTVTTTSSGPSAALQLTAPPTAPGLPAHPSLPAKPGVDDFAQRANSLGLGANGDGSSAVSANVLQALSGSNSDIVANRAAIRMANMANMNAAEMLKAELAGLRPVKATSRTVTSAPAEPAAVPSAPDVSETGPVSALDESMGDDEVPGFGAASNVVETTSKTAVMVAEDGEQTQPIASSNLVHGIDVADVSMASIDGTARGQKRTLEEVEAEPEADETLVEDANDAEETEVPPKVGKTVINADGSVEQEDSVRLYEPGYRERYYRHKFGAEHDDVEFRKQLVKSYVEGMAWVLQYYYQGTPSWQWYYPYHFAPFARDFEDIDKLDLQFNVGQPFKPFEQLMGVFPAASKTHIPAVFHSLMTDENSPIIDFYPESFEIDMNGKKMLWQGVALLPFIDEKRLLGAMAEPYKLLAEDEIQRNTWGNDVVFIGAENPLYPSFEALYGKRKNKDPVPMDVEASRGISGTLLPRPGCIPGSTYYSPLTSVGLHDLPNDRSLSALYFFPKQLTPHRSMLLPGVRRVPRVLTLDDLDNTRRRGNGGDMRMNRGGRPPRASHPQNRTMGVHNQQRDGGGGYDYGRGSYSEPRPHPSSNQYGGGGYGQQSYQQPPAYGASGRGGGPARGGGAYNPAGRGGPPSYGGYGGYGGSGGSGGSGGYGASGAYGNQGASGGYGSAPPPPNNGYGGYAGNGGYGGSGGYGGGGQAGHPSRGGASQYQGGRGAPRGRY